MKYSYPKNKEDLQLAIDYLNRLMGSEVYNLVEYIKRGEEVIQLETYDKDTDRYTILTGRMNHLQAYNHIRSITDAIEIVNINHQRELKVAKDAAIFLQDAIERL